MKLYIFRIIFMMYIYLVFVSKIILKYYHITEIYQILQVFIIDYQNIKKMTFQKALDNLDTINGYIAQIKARITKEIKGDKKLKRDDGISFYIQFLNLGVITDIKNNFFYK